jgi:hypothetical protein
MIGAYRGLILAQVLWPLALAHAVTPPLGPGYSPGVMPAAPLVPRQLPSSPSTDNNNPPLRLRPPPAFDQFKASAPSGPAPTPPSITPNETPNDPLVQAAPASKTRGPNAPLLSPTKQAMFDSLKEQREAAKTGSASSGVNPPSTAEDIQKVLAARAKSDEELISMMNSLDDHELMGLEKLIVTLWAQSDDSHKQGAAARILASTNPHKEAFTDGIFQRDYIRGMRAMVSHQEGGLSILHNILLGIGLSEETTKKFENAPVAISTSLNSLGGLVTTIGTLQGAFLPTLIERAKSREEAGLTWVQRLERKAPRNEGERVMLDLIKFIAKRHPEQYLKNLERLPANRGVNLVTRAGLTMIMMALPVQDLVNSQVGVNKGLMGVVAASAAELMISPLLVLNPMLFNRLQPLLGTVFSMSYMQSFKKEAGMEHNEFDFNRMLSDMKGKPGDSVFERAHTFVQQIGLALKNVALDPVDSAHMALKVPGMLMDPEARKHLLDVTGTGPEALQYRPYRTAVASMAAASAGLLALAGTKSRWGLLAIPALSLFGTGLNNAAILQNALRDAATGNILGKIGVVGIVTDLTGNLAQLVVPGGHPNQSRARRTYVVDNALNEAFRNSEAGTRWRANTKLFPSFRHLEYSGRFLPTTPPHSAVEGMDLLREHTIVTNAMGQVEKRLPNSNARKALQERLQTMNKWMEQPGFFQGFGREIGWDGAIADRPALLRKLQGMNQEQAVKYMGDLVVEHKFLIENPEFVAGRLKVLGKESGARQIKAAEDQRAVALTKLMEDSGNSQLQGIVTEEARAYRKQTYAGAAVNAGKNMTGWNNLYMFSESMGLTKGKIEFMDLVDALTGGKASEELKGSGFPDPKNLPKPAPGTKMDAWVRGTRQQIAGMTPDQQAMAAALVIYHDENAAKRALNGGGAPAPLDRPLLQKEPTNSPATPPSPFVMPNTLPAACPPLVRPLYTPANPGQTDFNSR